MIDTKTSSNWHDKQIQVLDGMPPFTIPLMAGVEVRWDAKVKNNNRLPVVVKFIPDDDVRNKFIEHIKQLQERIRTKKNQIAKGVDVNEDLISLENNLEASIKVMLDLQAETEARQKELETLTRKKDMLKSLCDLFLKGVPEIRSPVQQELPPKERKFGTGARYVQMNANVTVQENFCLYDKPTHTHTHTHTHTYIYYFTV